MPTPKPDATTDMILIRHGETAWNRELRFQGHADVPLNDIGHEQARRIGLRLAGETVQHMISSDLMRAQQTAAPAAQQLSLPVVTSAGLREQFFGIVEGMRSDEIQSLHPRAWEAVAGVPRRPRHARGRDGARVPCAHRRGAGHHRHRAQGAAPDRRHARRRARHGVAHRPGPEPERTAPQRHSQCGLQPHPHRRPGAPDDIEIVEWADTRHLADLPPQPTYDQTRHLKSKG
jgi:probable phosphoglycerate mutase